MRNFKKVLVNHIIDRTEKNEIPSIVQTQFKGNYKMYLYTLTTPQLGDIILYKR